MRTRQTEPVEVRFLRKCVLNLFSCLLLLSLAYHSFGQVLQPQPLPCLILNQPEVDVLYTSGGISHPECIETVSNLNFDPTVSYSVKAGDNIVFKEGAYIAPNSSNQYHAYIEQSAFDLAWYGPSQSGTVGQFEKLEIGLQFEDAINDEILNFVNDLSSNKLNPFNPDEIDVYAEFFYSEPGVGYGAAQRINGFYYEEFDRQTDWVELPTQHNFRFRFTPRKLGSYKCQITAIVNGHGTFHAAPFYFGCIASNSDDFIRVGDNKRYLRKGDEPFFPVGMNIFTHRNYIVEGGSSGPEGRYTPLSYDLYYSDLTELASYDANYFRHIVCPWANEIEFENVNDYSDRMDQSWEFDRLLDTAKTLDLKMHYNMQVHFAYETPAHYYNDGWDWCKRGDALYPDGCGYQADSGYCYRRLTDSELPSAMLTNPEAIKYYKYRLRYMVARWGYSSTIAIMELMSEINNLGAKTQYLVDGNSNCVRTDPHPPGFGQAYDMENGIKTKVFQWQSIMCQYIKDSLQHNNHPLAVNYTGQPDHSEDHSFASPYVDIASYNNYQIDINKGVLNYNEVTNGLHNPSNNSYIDKPIIHSEYGHGGKVHDCDGRTTFIQGLRYPAFIGTAGGFNWHLEFNDYGCWKYIKPIKDLMEGIKLDEENWTAGKPIVPTNSNHERVEVYYLVSQPTGFNAPKKAVGMIGNQTFNWYTQQTGPDCTDLGVYPGAAYDSPVTYQYLLNNNLKLKIPNMGANKDYIIRWYNGLTGDHIAPEVIVNSGLSENVELSYPGYLTHDSTQAIIFFEIWPQGGSIKSQLDIEANSYNEEDKFSEQNQIVSISPNPTNGKVILESKLLESLHYEMVILAVNGKQVYKEIISTQRTELNLAHLESGLYILKLQNGEDIKMFKLVKE